ncbi:MAG: hypothetical protein WA890_31295 [Micromonospora sp.]
MSTIVMLQEGLDAPVAHGDGAGRDGADVSPLVLQTWRDAWIYCKATKKTVANYRWVPGLSAFAAVISAITGTTIFANWQSDEVSTLARVVVGGVVLVTAMITGLQAWTTSRIKALNDQAQKFHDFHRKVLADMESGKHRKGGYPAEIERELEGIAAGMSEPSNRSWRAAKGEVENDILATCPQFTRNPHRPSSRR